MSLYIPEGTPPVVRNAMVRIERRLPHPGEVIVRAGSRVEPEDVIARAYVPTPPQIINVARWLGIAPRQVSQAMRREPGNKVAKGEMLARARRLGGRSCPAPVGGMITAIDLETGYVTIAPDPVSFDLHASVRGVVMDVQQLEGVIIETVAAEAYGAFGVGHERSGVLRLLVTDPGEMVTPDQIDARSAYAILICGAGISAAALRRAVQEQVRGVIVGGIEEQELRNFLGWHGLRPWQAGISTWQFPAPGPGSDPGLTLMVTEGFGLRPMTEPIFSLLSDHDRQEALIEGVTRLRSPLSRPRVVIPLTRGATGQIEPERPELRPGARVRLLDDTHLGQMATVRTISTAPRQIASGMRILAVEVVQDGEHSFWLPRSAVEVVG